MGDDVVRFKLVGRRLWVPNDVYKAIEESARQHGQTVEQWVEEAAKRSMETLERASSK